MAHRDSIAVLQREPWRVETTTTSTVPATTVTTTVAACAVYGPGAATWGNDIEGTHSATTSWRDCQTACNQNIACNVWAVDATGCYLKRPPAVAFPVAASLGRSGTKCNILTPTPYLQFQNCCADLANIQAHVPIAQPAAASLGQCEATCTADSACIAFEFYPNQGPVVEGVQVSCFTAAAVTPQEGSVNRVPMQGKPSPRFRDALCNIRAPSCTADYATAVGAPTCCGQPGTVLGQDQTCPSFAPVCRGYISGAAWGSCGRAEIVVASIEQDYAVIPDVGPGDLALLWADYTFISMGSFTSANNFTYIRASDKDKYTPSSQVQLALSLPTAAIVYLAYYGGADLNHEQLRPWIKDEAWYLEATLSAPAWTGSAVDAIWAKLFFAGVAAVKGHNGNGTGPPLVFIEQVALWPQLGMNRSRCSSQSRGCPWVQDQAMCQRAAVAAGHEFFDFDAKMGCCVSSRSCDTLTLATPSAWSIFIKPQCFSVNVRFQPLDMPGQAPTDESSASACQARCEVVPNCVHFSWSGGGCHLQDDSAQQVPAPYFVAGPPSCQVASCRTYACPAGYMQKQDQETLSCRATSCSLADTETCCNEVPGVVLDFVQRVSVPESYNFSEPAFPSSGQVPGAIGQALWAWASNPDFGRLPPGSAAFPALGVQANLQRGGGGWQLCARVYQEATYCPAARLNTPMYEPLPLGPAARGEQVMTVLLRDSPPWCKENIDRMPGTRVECAAAAASLQMRMVDMNFSELAGFVGRRQQFPLCWSSENLAVVVWNVDGVPQSAVQRDAELGILSGLCLAAKVCQPPTGDRSLDSQCWSAALVDSTCPVLDTLLQAAQSQQASTDLPYQRLDMRVSDLQVLARRTALLASGQELGVSAPSPSAPTCGTGKCLSFHNGSFEVGPGSAGCGTLC